MALICYVAGWGPELPAALPVEGGGLAERVCQDGRRGCAAAVTPPGGRGEPDWDVTAMALAVACNGDAALVRPVPFVPARPEQRPAYRRRYA